MSEKLINIEGMNDWIDEGMIRNEWAVESTTVKITPSGMILYSCCIHGESQFIRFIFLDFIILQVQLFCKFTSKYLLDLFIRFH